MPQWLAWARRHMEGLTPEVEKGVISISPRQSDRRLASEKRRCSRLIGRYGEARSQGEEMPARKLRRRPIAQYCVNGWKEFLDVFNMKLGFGDGAWLLFHARASGFAQVGFGGMRRLWLG